MDFWSSSVVECKSFADGLEELRSGIEHFISALDRFGGYCLGCERIVTFYHRRPADGGWSDLRENIVCDCGLNGRARMIFETVRDPLLNCQGLCVAFEHNTPLFGLLQAVRPDLIGSEFLGEDCTGGRYYKLGLASIRHEDLMAQSFESDSVGFLFHGDVLEHVSDPVQALQECFRVLRLGGVMYFTTPFFFIDSHFVRARVEQGRLRHYAEEIYHGNPVSAKGSLVFTEFGMPLMEDIAGAGFKDIKCGILYDPLKGIISNNNPYRSGRMWPIIFKAVKTQ